MKLLYISANPKKDEYSVSKTLGATFLEKIKAKYENIEINSIDLFKEDIPDIDYDVMNAFGKLMFGQPGELTDIEQDKINKRTKVLEQFIESDIIVFATPMWEFMYPSVVKKYLDVVTSVNKTFRYNEEGMPIGLLADQNKKVIHIQASGGVYSNNFDENLKDIPTLKMAKNYSNEHLEANMRFLGINEYHHIYASGQSMSATKDEKIKEANKQLDSVIDKI